MDVESYGRSYFSASDSYFLFSYADALHNQHFIGYKFIFNHSNTFAIGDIKKEFVLLDR